MRTFIRGEEPTSRFWKIERAGAVVTIQYGKVGSKGTSSETPFATESEARTIVRRRISEKKKEGYVETFTLDPMLRSLDASILDNPEDLAAAMARADWLSEHADPKFQVLGEFAQVQIALEDATKTPEARRKLRQRETQLFDEHRQAWIPCLAPLCSGEDPSIEVRFRRGLLDTLVIPSLNFAVALQLQDAGELCYLRRLIVVNGVEQYLEHDQLTAEGLPRGYYSYPGMFILGLNPNFDNVRSFSFGDVEGDRNYETFPTSEGVFDLLNALPKLEELHLNAFEIEPPELFSASCMANLHTLRLERIRLRNPGIALLVGSQVWQKLRVLQIWGGRFDDKGAKALAKCKALKNLTFLDLSFNWLTATGIAALRKTGVNLVAEHQLTSSTDTDIDWADDVDDEFEDDDFYNDFEDEFGDDDSEWE